MQQPMVISAIGGDRESIGHSLTPAILDCSNSIKENHMLSLESEFTMLVNIPAVLHISNLREKFMEFSNQINLDEIMETVKNS